MARLLCSYLYSLGSTRFMKVARSRYRLVLLVEIWYRERASEREREREREIQQKVFLWPYSLHHFLGRDETDVVVKVFAKHDPSLKLEAHEKKLYGKQVLLLLLTPRTSTI